MSDYAALRRLAEVAIDADLTYVSVWTVIDPATFYRPVLDLIERLEMAEDLLRRAHHVGFHFGGGVAADAIWCIGKSWGEVHVDVTAHEAKYLWSLFGEGE